MRTIHYYCNPQCVPVNEPLSSEAEIKAIESVLTWGMVTKAISQFATGDPPYILSVPAEFLTYAYEAWKHPTRLVRVIPKHNRSDKHPVDTCELQFNESFIVFHALRYFPTMAAFGNDA